ncbi:hypothetical protein LZ752_08650 [Xylella fastidiosa subsp. fastidiosa]|uniref:hypothetical protein n=1 Tax=Xylella fastidiosa TaxID=2371 RepID=UPI00111DF94C|nr:hypothetical protein [Xylella fastidiosa]UIT49605.1 hypothetical protein LZ752_08650 [Xylella fastidiosa subsp. fastidiosa]
MALGHTPQSTRPARPAADAWRSRLCAPVKAATPATKPLAAAGGLCAGFGCAAGAARPRKEEAPHRCEACF